jgi:hypothetical protein
MSIEADGQFQFVPVAYMIKEDLYSKRSSL